jgi:hypothetical protein
VDESAEDYLYPAQYFVPLFDLFVPFGTTMLKAPCAERRPDLLDETLAAAWIDAPATDGGMVRFLSSTRLVREILDRFVVSVTDARAVAEGPAKGSVLQFDVVMAIVRQWILETGGFDTLPGLDAAIAQRLDSEIRPGIAYLGGADEE